jgi:hypothetical protein
MNELDFNFMDDYQKVCITYTVKKKEKKKDKNLIFDKRSLLLFLILFY